MLPDEETVETWKHGQKMWELGAEHQRILIRYAVRVMAGIDERTRVRVLEAIDATVREAAEVTGMDVSPSGSGSAVSETAATVRSPLDVLSREGHDPSVTNTASSGEPTAVASSAAAGGSLDRKEPGWSRE